MCAHRFFSSAPHFVVCMMILITFLLYLHKTDGYTIEKKTMFFYVVNALLSKNEKTT